MEALVKVIAVGVPALLIVLGFFAYVSGTAVETVGTALGNEAIGDAGLKALGLGMIIAGIIIYLIEIAVYVSESR